MSGETIQGWKLRPAPSPAGSHQTEREIRQIRTYVLFEKKN